MALRAQPRFQRALILFFLIHLPTPAPAQDSLDSVDNLLSARTAALSRMENGSFGETLLLLKDALGIAQDRYGPTHLSIAPLLTDLATLHRVMGRYGEAESALKWGLALRERKLGPDDPQLADSLGHLASLYNDWGRWEEAAFYGKRALAIQEKKGGTGEVILALSLLGDIQLNLQRAPEAQVLLSRSLALQEKAAASPARTVILLSALSKAYSAGNRPADAESSLRKALALSQKSFPADSIEVADATQRLADLYASTDRPERSKPLYGSALHIYKSYVGVHYGYSVLPYLQRLAKACQTAGDNAQAKDLLEKALTTTKEVYGPDHPLVAVTLDRLAGVEEKLGQKKDAAAHRKGALGILRSHFAKDHPWIRKVEAELGK